MESREEFARTVGVSKDALAMYERGENVPSAAVLAAYRKRYGISFEWMVFGDGVMFADPSKAPTAKAKPLDEMLMRTLAQIAIRAHQQAQLVLRQEDIAVEAACLYNELKEKADDINDAEEVNDLLPWLERRLTRRLEKLKADPVNTTSKRA
ncbi:MAG: helix-turn-helix transcriptional regulator [Shinella sp.]|nr:helix-turn-helix transcriptional regulator [Shinella sp.]